MARTLEVEVAAAVEAARTGVATWQRLRAAAEGMRRHVELVNRAYQLGESGLSEVLAARRLAVESQTAAVAAQADAQEGRYRLLLDAHMLWPLDPEPEPGR